MNDRSDEDTWVMETSSYSQVVFSDVRPSYLSSSAVTCRYTVTDGLQTSATDRIAVFKVGWQSTQEYYSCVCVQMDLDQLGSESLIREVVFKENDLPKDDGEFYQFCYVDSCGHIRGASTPFCFQNPTESGPDCSWEKNLLVVTTQEQLELQEKEKEDFVKEIESLKESRAILKNELDERLREIFCLKSCLHDLKLKDKLESPISDVQDHNITEQSLTSLQEKYEKAVQKINMLKREKVELQERVERQFAEELKQNTFLTEAEHKNSELQDRVRLLKVDVQSSRKENEKLQVELEELRKVRKTLEERREEHKVPQTSMSEQERKDNDAKVQIDALVTQLTEARELLHRETQKCNNAVKHAENAEQELREMRRKLTEINESESEKNGQIKAQLQRAKDKMFEMAETSSLDMQRLTEKNEELQAEVDQLREAVLNYQVAFVAASSEQLLSPQSPPASSSTQQQTPPPDQHIYKNNNDETGGPSRTENKMGVCQHCWEKFPGITGDELAEHELSHKVCPFCSVLCDDLQQQQFEDHVYSHE